ncbi:MAG: GNAT family N-acetyltransferase [Promethearchaeota archaeon]
MSSTNENNEKKNLNIKDKEEGEVYNLFLSDEKLGISEVKKENIKIYCNWLNYYKVRHFLGRFLPLTISTLEDKFKKMADGKFKNEIWFELIYMPENKLIGLIIIKRFHWNQNNCQAEVLIGEHKYWSKENLNEAFRILDYYVFKDLGLKNLNIYIPGNNQLMKQFLEDMNYTLAYKRKESYLIDGEIVDELCYRKVYDDVRSLELKNMSINYVHEESKKENKSQLSKPIKFKRKAFLKYGKVKIHEINLEHKNLYLKWNNNYLVRRYARSNIPATYADVETWFKNEECEYPREIFFELAIADGDIPIGFVGLHSISWHNSKASIGLTIGEPKYWGKGYASDATKLILQYGFNELGLERIRAEIAEVNIGSWRVAEKCGLKFEGLDKKAEFIDGKDIDFRLYTISKQEWENTIKNK